MPTPPSSVTGSCLCGAIKFTATLTDWPPKTINCHCTMCRKWSSSLFGAFLALPATAFQPPLDSNKTYKRYKSSETAVRSFCTECGAGLAYESEVDGVWRVEIGVGTLDEKWVIGEEVEGSEKQTSKGREVERHGGFGKELCSPQLQYHYRNVIPGVTEGGTGTKYLGTEREGEGFD